jgi:hypothetical protein
MNKMNYLQIMLSAFARPGLAIHGCFAAALAVTVKDLVDRRVLLRAPFFEPDLSVGLPVACVLPSGRTRLLDALQAHCHHPELLSGPFRVLGSITLWDLGSVELAQTKEIRQRAVTLADAFDARQPEDAAAALWTGTAEVFEDASDYLSHLLVRSAIIPTPTGKWGGATTVRDAESSSRARDQLLQFLSGLGSSPVFEFDRPAQDLLLSMPPYPLPMWRHKRVLTAKLSAVLAAGRCALLGGSAIITAGEVETARKLVFSSVASTPEPQEQKQEEDDLYRRLQASLLYVEN